jgi:hypothetical protein
MHLCDVVVLQWMTVPIGTALSLRMLQVIPPDPGGRGHPDEY